MVSAISTHVPLAGYAVIVISVVACPVRFQLTYPTRGTTCMTYIGRGVGYFNSRTPCGIRLGPRCPRGAFCLISTHVPLVGYDVPSIVFRDSTVISTHVPLVGYDDREKLYAVILRNFNSRTPCGVRLVFGVPGRAAAPFQLTYPLWGTTTRYCVFSSTECIYCNTPIRNAT